jgi:peptidoglycan/LPS O-acetylase OafA/YrhL
MSSIKYRPDIDGLRGIAVLSVVGFHAFGVTGGYIGVDIFFVISGFLITTILLTNLEKNNFSLLDFYYRRVKRIFPALILVLLFCIIFGWFTLYPDEYKHLAQHTLGSIGFVSNFILWNESGYFDIEAEKKLLLHLWSLSIEEQFYLLWPFLIWLLWQFRRYLLIIILFTLLCSFLLNIWFVNKDIVTVFYSPVTRMWELIIGGVLAYLTLFNKKITNLFVLNSNIISITGILILAACISFYHKNLIFPGWWALLPILGTSLLIISGPTTVIGEKLLSNTVLVWFGLISYPLYLWHWPLLTFAKILTEDLKSIKILIVVVAILLSYLTYKFVEKPIRAKTNSRKIIIFLIINFIIIGLISLYITMNNGVESRIDDMNSQGQTAKYQAQIKWPESYNRDDACSKVFGGDQYCLIHNINLPPTDALIGDSHANHFYFGLSHYLAQRGRNLLFLGAGGCAPFFDIDRVSKPSEANFDCYQRTNKLYIDILNNKNIKTVFISFYHNLTFDNSFIFKDRRNEINVNDPYLATTAAFKRTIQMFEKNGKQVVLIYDLPNLSTDIKKCAFQRPYQMLSKCDLESISMINDFALYDKMILEVQKDTSLSIFDTRPFIAGNFPIDKSKNLNYRDATHLSKSGSLFFSDKFNF